MNAGSERHFRCLNLPDLIARGADSWEISRMPESADTPDFFRRRLVEVQRWAENVVWQHFSVRSRLQRRYGRVGRIARDFALSIDLHQPFRDFDGLPEVQFQRSLARAERKFDRCRRWAAR
jgi:hypothetical protein